MDDLFRAVQYGIIIFLLPIGFFACEQSNKQQKSHSGFSDMTEDSVSDSSDASLSPSSKTPECQAEKWSCSADGNKLTYCEQGVWTEVNCMVDQGGLCEQGQCVLPAKYGSPDWSTCENDPLGTPETLLQKAIYYEDIVGRLHLHPQLKWVMGVELPCKQIECESNNGQPPTDGQTCEDCTETDVEYDQATWQDVKHWQTSENDGLWNGLYIAAEAFRYAVTKDSEALQRLKLLLEGELVRARITSVPGIFTRQYIPPNIQGIDCPDSDHEYIRDLEKDDNQWVQIREDGCIWYVDELTLAWKRSDRCNLEEFAGYCWLDNVSKDEYAGHMMAIGALGKLVDDPEVQSAVRGLCQEVGEENRPSNW